MKRQEETNNTCNLSFSCEWGSMATSRAPDTCEAQNECYWMNDSKYEVIFKQMFKVTDLLVLEYSNAVLELFSRSSVDRL